MNTPHTTSKSHIFLWSLVVIMAVVLGAILVRQPGLLTASSAGTMEKAEMQGMVREYILDNPEIIAEAIDELRRRHTQAEVDESREQIALNREAIFHDAASVATTDADAGVVNVAEFFDYNCGYCRQSHEATKKLQAKEGVRFVFKEFPILGPGSVYAAKAAIASIQQGEDKYIAFHDALMTHPGRVDEKAVLDVAEKVGLDVEKMKTDMQAPEVQETIDRNMALAESIGVSGTPAFIIDDELVPGAAEYSYLEELVDEKSDS